MSSKPGTRTTRYRRRTASQQSAMLLRVKQRIAARGTLKIPAVPSLLESYVQLSASFFSASGRHFASDEVERARSILSTALSTAFAGSPRSKIVISYEAEPGCPLGYSVEPNVSTIADAYERWIGTSNAPLFGAHPDARVWSIAQQFENPSASPVLDLGAGTGRNAFALAERGFVVDAVELTPKFAQMLAETAKRRQLHVRVIAENVFAAKGELRRDYRFFFASEVVPDFRGVAELRQLFELAAEVLQPGGILLFNIHLAAHGFTPDKAAREFAQQCYSALFTTSELREAMAGLPFELDSNDSVYQYELKHLPEGVFPPTPWFVNWISGLDVYEVETEKCPVELRWLAFRRTSEPSAKASAPAFDALLSAERFEAGNATKTNRPHKFDAAQLRTALVRRLTRRAVAAGALTLPAVPALGELYMNFCLDVFASLGRTLTQAQVLDVKQNFARALSEAYQASPRSNIAVTYEISMGSEVHYTVAPAPVAVAQAYEDWHEHLAESLFGENPDARLRTLVEAAKAPMCVLDIGAGTGRNALWLASRGHTVDALEISHRFAELVRSRAAGRNLAIRITEGDFFLDATGLAPDYALIVASGFVGDLRGLSQLRQLFEIASGHLVSGGKLLLNLHRAINGYAPDPTTLQWAEQCCATIFTPSELERAHTGLGFVLVSDDNALDYEHDHLPEDQWPPTPAFPEWASGQHMFALERELSPIELRWLLFEKA